MPLTRGGNKITVVAQAADGGTNMRQVTVVSFGTRIGGFTDPSGDDNGPGTYVYPTNPVYQPGIFDLTGLEVYLDGDDALLVAKIRGDVTNPWGGEGISHQRFNVYLGSGTGAAAAALPGTNMDTASAWTRAVVGDGRFDTAGVYTPDGTRAAAGHILAVPQTHHIAVVVPRSALTGIDLPSARYGIAMFGNAEPSEGIGYVRPVYDYDYWNNSPNIGLWWIKEIPLWRRRRRVGRLARQQGHRHPRPQRTRRAGRHRAIAIAGARLAHRLPGTTPDAPSRLGGVADRPTRRLRIAQA